MVSKELLMRQVAPVLHQQGACTTFSWHACVFTITIVHVVEAVLTTSLAEMWGYRPPTAEEAGLRWWNIQAGWDLTLLIPSVTHAV